ncbi:MAG: amidase [Rubrivivax sp.]|nr:amidase [Rubrivivax sp.]
MMRHESATNQLKALQSGNVGSAELVERAIERIRQVDGALNAVVVRDFDRAREAGRAADQARRRGDDRPLLGLPMTVKEAFDVAGLPTTWGLLGNHSAATTDAVVVERLRSAGAIVLGKTNVATMLADWQTANPAYGVTNNPWDMRRTPGGSSGGSAAAVASGITALELGSDLAGSLRIPAAFCGVFAHRPSQGTVPMRGFAPPMAPRMRYMQAVDQAAVGPLARSAADLRLALDVLAGPDVPASTGLKLSLLPPRHTELRAYRVLVLDEHPLIPTAGAIREALQGLAERLANAGCRVGRETREAPDLKDLNETFTSLLMAFMGVDVPDEEYAAAAEAARHGDWTQQRMTMSHRDWMHLDRHRLALAEQWSRTFARWDAVLCPAAPCTAFAHDAGPFGERTLSVDGEELGYAKLPCWTTLAVPTGLPVTTVPIGVDAAGLPIGAQLIGPFMEDHTPIALAGLLEQQLGCSFCPPPLDP